MGNTSVRPTLNYINFIKRKNMWSHTNLWEKSKEYIERALDLDDRTSHLFPFWCTLSLELLTRASLSKIHPALLADTHQNGDSVLYACGIAGIKSPKSIPTKIVLLRCKQIIEKFTEKDMKFCVMLTQKRNEELHSGGQPFDNMNYSDWLPEYYRILKILIEFNEKNLVDFLGTNEASVANKMIDALLGDKKKEAFELIKKQAINFKKLPVAERLGKIQASRNLRMQDYGTLATSKNIECPSCEGSARIIGELIRSSVPKEEDSELIQEDLYLPKKLQCYSCGLIIDGYNYLHGVGLGSTYKKKDILDPVEYFDIDPTEYIDENNYYNEYY